ncbi:MAG TPA: sigma-70 family RNA polymerase sigma factor [Pelobium sp.]|nr:sigma-70 family RNA polymerase sigma factor [Pelobium sp.]
MGSLQTELSKLWEQSCSGSQQAFTSLHNMLFPKLFAYAKNIVRDTDVANDLIQDLFMKLWEKKAKIGEIENVQGYFYRSTSSIAFNYLRRQKLAQKIAESNYFDEVTCSIEDYIISQELSDSLRNKMRSAVGRLSFKQKEIIEMSFYESLNYNQIMEVTGLQYQSVVNHVHRAVKVLRKDLKEVAIVAA